MPQDLQTWGGTGRFKGDQIRYFRRPRDAEHHAGWITWGDSVSGTKFRDMVARRFEPLMHLPIINTKEHEEKGWGIWEPILSHPNGPTEFPVEQIIVARWYKECPIPGVRFPQLQGMKIVEYRCPQCARKPFPELKRGAEVVVSAVGALGNHLTIMHKWDRLALLGYGDRIGIDFQAPDARTDITYEFEEESKDETETADFEIEVVGGRDCPKCDWKPKANAKRPEVALRMHLRGHAEPVPA